MVPLALLALAQPELNCQDAAPPHNPHLHYRQRTKGWVGGGPHTCSYFHADPFACDTLRWADESDREEWDVAPPPSCEDCRTTPTQSTSAACRPSPPAPRRPAASDAAAVFLIVPPEQPLPRAPPLAALVVLVCGGCAYYQNAKKKKAVEVGLDADSLKFEGVGP